MIAEVLDVNSGQDGQRDNFMKDEKHN